MAAEILPLVERMEDLEPAQEKIGQVMTAVCEYKKGCQWPRDQGLPGDSEGEGCGQSEAKLQSMKSQDCLMWL